MHPRFRRVPVILQSEMAECGHACLAMIANYFGHALDLPALRRRLGSSERGASMLRLVQDGARLGLHATGKRVSARDIGAVKLPALAHWEGNHFVVVTRARRGGVTVHDPAVGRRTLSRDEFAAGFSGTVLEFEADAAFAPIVDRAPIRFAAAWRVITEEGRALAMLAVLSVAIEVLALSLPIAIQFVIDRGIGDANAELIAIGVGVAGVLVAIQLLLEASRGVLGAWIGTTLHARWTSRLFRHLLGVPIDYIARRSLGELLSRFGAMASLRQALTTDVVRSVLEGLTAIGTLALLAMYSPPSALIAAIGCLAVLVLYGFTAERVDTVNGELINVQARAHTEVLEAIRAIRTIKLMGTREQHRARFESGAWAVAERELWLKSLQSWLGGAQEAICHAVRLGVLCAVGLGAARAQLSMGALVAVLALTDHFMRNVNGLLARVSDFIALRPTIRKAVETFQEPVEEVAGVTGIAPSPEAAITLRDVSYRYGPDEPWVLSKFNLSVRAGEAVAIAGNSGCGKSTLVHLIVGLLRPTEGEVLFGGVEISRFGLDRYRQRIAVVLQDDQLLAGCVADNISLFDPHARLEDIIAAASAAGIHEEILRTTMGYDTLVGDRGFAFSGGQRQRILLARALYRKPQVLILDEATSHLDPENTRRIDAAIRALKITRLIVAHNERTIALADRCVRLTPAVEIDRRAS